MESPVRDAFIEEVREKIKGWKTPVKIINNQISILDKWMNHQYEIFIEDTRIGAVNFAGTYMALSLFESNAVTIKIVYEYNNPDQFDPAIVAKDISQHVDKHFVIDLI